MNDSTNEKGDPTNLRRRRIGKVESWASGFHMALCDGSVRLIGYHVHPRVHMFSGNRRDGQIVELE